MCGICGFCPADPAETVDAAALARMNELLRHRGPDGDGLHLAPGVGLAVRRLAINDLLTGDQPISGEDGTVTVVCNGEIYNFVELRAELEAAGHRFKTRSDVEVIVHLYEDRGPDCLAALRGMFGLALWDARRCRLLLARDRLGIKPLHYALGPWGCLFGSEQKAILADPRVARELDPAALHDLFTFGFVTGPKSTFGAIRRLLPGQYLLYQDGAATLRRYWEPSFPRRGEEDRATPADVWAERLLEKLDEAVRLHLRSDVPVGAWLSPGVDSSSVAALASRHAGRPPRTFSLTFDQPKYDEVGRRTTLDQYPEYGLEGRRVACEAGDLELLPRAVWHLEDPLTALIEIPQLKLAEATGREVKVLLGGEGADEVLGGYPWYACDLLLRPLARLPLGLRRLMLLGPLLPARWPWASRLLLGPHELGPERFRRIVTAAGEADWRALLSPALRATLGQTPPGADWPTPPADFDRWHPFNQLQYLDLTVRLPCMVTHELDRSTMAHSVEARVPFLDHELVELCAQIPVGLKQRGWEEKHILRRAMRGRLPEAIRRRRKVGLRAPGRAWLRGPLPAAVERALSHEALVATGYFDPPAVATALAQLRAGRSAASGPLVGVLMVQLWDELLRRGCPVA